MIWILGLGSHARGALVSSLVLALAAGIAALVLHRRTPQSASAPEGPESPMAGYDMRRLYQNRVLSERVASELLDLRRQADAILERPEQAGDILLQLQRILPEEGLLTEQLAGLRAIAHRVRKGHVARIEELREVIARLPPERRRKLAEELRRRYQELQFDIRLERLDSAVAKNERRIRELTRQAQDWLAARDYRNLSGVLDQAARLQRRNASLLQVIERSQARLLGPARQFRETSVEVSSG